MTNEGNANDRRRRRRRRKRVIVRSTMMGVMSFQCLRVAFPSLLSLRGPIDSMPNERHSRPPTASSARVIRRVYEKCSRREWHMGCPHHPSRPRRRRQPSSRHRRMRPSRNSRNCTSLRKEHYECYSHLRWYYYHLYDSSHCIHAFRIPALPLWLAAPAAQRGCWCHTPMMRLVVAVWPSPSLHGARRVHHMRPCRAWFELESTRLGFTVECHSHLHLAVLQSAHSHQNGTAVLPDLDSKRNDTPIYYTPTSIAKYVLSVCVLLLLILFSFLVKFASPPSRASHPPSRRSQWTRHDAATVTKGKQTNTSINTTQRG